MKVSGIYTITNKIDRKLYLGKSNNIYSRKEQHFRTLRNNNHHCIFLQRAFNKYGEKNFEFDILWECSEELLYSEENYWGNLLNVCNPKFGYNIQFTSSTGRPMPSNNTKLMISNSLKKPVVLLSKSGSYINRYDSTQELCKDKNLQKNLVSKVLNGKMNSYKNFIFIFEHKYDTNKDYSISNVIKSGKRIIMSDLNKNIISEFVSITEASKFIKCKTCVLWKVINRKKNKEYKNFIWEYKQKTISTKV